MTPKRREGAAERMRRVLAEILWIAERDGPTAADAAARFGVTEAELHADLELASMIGADSDDYQEMPVEMFVEGERVFVHLHAFDRPLRLTPAEALSLVVAGSALSGSTGSASIDTALARARAKVAAALGIAVGEHVDVDLGVADAALFATVRDAVEQHRALEIDHIRVETDTRTRRVVEPWGLFRERGAWYLSGHCRRAGSERVFRVDRIVAATALDEPVDPPPDRPAESALRAAADAPRITLALDPEARWVVESHPTERVDTRPDGTIEATLVVASPVWLERLLLRLGPAARIVALDPPLADPDPAAAAARRVLARYRAATSPL